jgi:hypothetical protein
MDQQFRWRYDAVLKLERDDPHDLQSCMKEFFGHVWSVAALINY